MAYLARVTYTGNGSTTGYALPFSYIATSHIQAFIDNVQTTAFSISGSTLTFNSAPANAAVITIKRVTPTNARLVDFTDGSVLTEADLDQSADQNFYIAQEVSDTNQTQMGLDNSDRWDANSKRIINVANPVDNQDAVTKYHLENVWLASSDKTNINLVGTNIASVNTVATNIADVITVANDLNEAVAEIDTVAGAITNVDLVGNNIANVNTLAGITNLTNLANAHAAVSTVATNLAAVQNFADVYRISASAPVSSLNVGDLYFDTAQNELKVYKSSGWAAAGSTVNGTAQRYTYNITGTPNSVSGADIKGDTLAYDAGFVDVFLNGVRLSNSSGSYTGDVTVSSGNSVVFANNLAANDVVDVVAYGTFSVASIAASAITSGVIPFARGGTGLGSLGTAGQVLKVNSGASALEYGQASSAEVYGFSKNSDSQLIITTTNQGADNITSSTFATFDDCVFGASGFTFSISNGELITTI